MISEVHQRKELANNPGVVLSDQVKSLDWSSMNIEYIAKASDSELKEVLDTLKVLLF